MEGRGTTGSRSGGQRFATRLVSPAGKARMEAESRTWIVRCGKCGYERSAWDAGAAIYKGAGTRYWYLRCPKCGQRSWNKVYWPAGVKKADVYAQAAAANPGLPNKTPWLLWAVAALAWTGSIVVFVLLVLWLVNTVF